MSVARKSFLFFIFVDLVLLAVVLGVVRNFRFGKRLNLFHPILNENLTAFNDSEDFNTTVLTSSPTDHVGKSSDAPPVPSDVLSFIDTGKKLRDHSSTYLVPHRVYFDRRSWASHSNSTVVLVSVHADYRDKILGCEIDGNPNEKTIVKDVAIAWFIARYFPVSHRDCFVYCFNTIVSQNSSVSVLYKKNGKVIKEPVRADGVVIPPTNAPEKDEVMVCASGFGVVSYLDQWLTYQKTVGIKFIHINVDPSFLQNLNKSAILVNDVKSGFVKMVVWQDYLNSSQVYYYSQSLKYQDCALRYQGIYKYMLVIDFDEYFIPFGPNNRVLFYAKKLIKGRVGSALLARQEYHNKSKDFEKLPCPSDGNMTKLYDTSTPIHPGEGKSLHLVKVLEHNSIHHAQLLPRYRVGNFKGVIRPAGCYIAHLTHKHTRRK